MASTRNKNTRGNYALDQRQIKQADEYLMNREYSISYNTSLPGNGLLVGQIPREKMASNYVQIESYLLGVGSTNLVNPEAPLVPELKKLDTVNIYNKKPTLMPLPLVIERNRPFPCP
jgi:hypothetical protein